MNIIKSGIDLFLHLDKHLISVVTQYGTLTYVLLFGVIFLETGLVVTPFLPGDSLLFVAGTLAATNALNIYILLVILCFSAVLGDTVNYWIGHFIGPKVFKRQNARFFKPEYLEKTRQFYAKYGGKTIILARFVPIIRTFAPFVAGVGKMHYGQFISYNFIGGILWVSLFVSGGYFFGNLPIVKNNFHTAIFLIIFLSLLPGALEYFKHKRQKTRAKHFSTDLEKIEKTFHKKHITD